VDGAKNGLAFGAAGEGVRSVGMPMSVANPSSGYLLDVAPVTLDRRDSGSDLL